jgi:hypothetical protein
VKFTIFKNWTTDYNKIPAENAAVEAIDVAGVSVMDVGLEHLGMLNGLYCICLVEYLNAALVGAHEWMWIYLKTCKRELCVFTAKCVHFFATDLLVVCFDYSIVVLYCQHSDKHHQMG